VSLAFIEKCKTHDQRPEGILVIFGTFESVAYVAKRVLVLPATLVVTVCSTVPVPIGDHCLYVGLPNAVSVFNDWFR
jgi:hypothetical protein